MRSMVLSRRFSPLKLERLSSSSRLAARSYPIYLFLPGFVVYVLLFILPFILSSIYSFSVWDYFTAKFVGFLNYRLFFEDPQVMTALKNTLIFTVLTAIVQTTIGMALAVLLNRISRIVNVLRTVLFLPVVLNTVAVGIILSAMLHFENGLVNRLLRQVGLIALARDWFGDPKLAIYSVIFINTWRWSGFAMMILLAGMQSIPHELYEAAQIDGTGSWRKFWHITFPLILPAFNNLMVVTIIGSLKVFDIVMVTTGGGPAGASEVLNSVIYRNYGYGLYGLASAETIILSILVIVVSMSTYLVGRRKEVQQ